MKQIAFGLSALTLSAAPVEAQDFLGSVASRLEESASHQQSPQNEEPPPRPRRSRMDEMTDPQLDNTARVDADKICFPYLRVGGRPAEVCVPATNFADTLPEAADMSALTFAGNMLGTTPADLARCYIRLNTDPNLSNRVLDDPAISQQLNVTCPNRRHGGGTYRLTLMFNRHYYVPLQLSDTVCGPDRSVLGSEFDSYVRSSLGEPSQVENDDDGVKGYYWLNTSTTMALTPSGGGRQSACDSPMSTQRNWSARIMLNNSVGDRWLAYLRTAAQEQRDGSFTRF